MTDRPSIADVAQAYLAAGLCVLSAIRAEKRPAVGRWKQYQKRLPTPAELSAWMANNPDAVCILCGAASNNAEIIDFDGGGELFSAWWGRIPADLRERLVVERTPSGGWHVIYRCIVAVCGNLKLAQRRVGEKTVTLIETRGEGGLFLCAPTAGYEITQGDLCDLPVLTEAERDVLLQAAWDLNECPPPVVNGPTHSAIVGQRGALSVGQARISADSSDNGGCPPDSAHMCDCPSDNRDGRPMSVDMSHICGISADDADNGPLSADRSQNRPMSADNADRPGDDFNVRGDVRAVLQQHGWVRLTDRQGAGGNEYWRRPGKDSHEKGWSATLKECSEGWVFYVFSSNAAPFEPQTGYLPFAVYTLLEHGGDFEQAARSLRTMGFGGDSLTDNADGVDISAIVRQGAPSPADNADDGLPAIRCLKELLDTFTGLHPPIIHGLLREGETMNIIAAPKMGKSWLAIGLATCIASGPERFGMTGRERAMLYRLAVETGLRAGEIRSLTRASFELDATPPVVRCLAAHTKNGKQAIQPLSPSAAEVFRDFLALKAPATPAFTLPKKHLIADMVREDLAAAGIPFRDDAGRKVDFHALRHTFITNLARAGVHPRIAQKLARHSTVDLTMSHYTFVALEDNVRAVAALPDLDATDATAAEEAG